MKLTLFAYSRLPSSFKTPCQQQQTEPIVLLDQGILQ